MLSYELILCIFAGVLRRELRGPVGRLCSKIGVWWPKCLKWVTILHQTDQKSAKALWLLSGWSTLIILINSSLQGDYLGNGSGEKLPDLCNRKAVFYRIELNILSWSLELGIFHKCTFNSEGNCLVKVKFDQSWRQTDEPARWKPRLQLLRRWNRRRRGLRQWGKPIQVRGSFQPWCK